MRLTGKVTHHVLAAGLLASALSCAATPGAPDSVVSKDIPLNADKNIVEARVPAHATLETLLKQNDISAAVAEPLIASVRTVFNPRELRTNQTYRLSRTIDGLLREFRYQIDADRLLRVVFRDRLASGKPEFDAEVVSVPKEISIEAAVADISREHSSLVGALDAAGESVQLALQLAEIFGGEIDFNSDLQRGDRIEVLFERARRDGAIAGYGEIKAAVLQASGRRITAIRYEGADGKPGWYDDQGRSLKRQFLRSPLPFEPRVTSRFSYRRVNPVHGGVRPHLGVDYGAAVGTPVMAASAGVVDFAGMNGEAGRMVRLRHAGGYQTLYLHLSAFGPSIRVGVRVDQGQLIGRVGMTGTATGPHLDYRIMKNGVYVNPLLELSRMPPGEPIAAAALPAFGRDRDALMAQLGDRLRAAANSPGATHPAR